MIYYRIHDGLQSDGKIKHKILDKNNNVVADTEVLDYIKKLTIPPAYKDVKIFYEKNPKILFEGFDDKGRKQQIYSESHKKKSSTKKFCSLIEFGKVIPKIESDITRIIGSSRLTKNKLIALIIQIVILCGFRIGNIKYQKLYNSFGISNITKDHITIKDNEMHIKFIGKKGVLNECVIIDSILIAELKKLIIHKSPSDYVFTYKLKDDDTDINISTLDINKWLKEYHVDITSKMFRTWDTNIMFIDFMRNKEDPNKLTKSNRKKLVLESLKEISCQINNTPNICKKEYLHIDLWTMFIMEPKKYKKYFNNCISAKTCFVNYLTKKCKPIKV